MLILFGAVQGWLARHDMGPDGISYLDIGDAWFRGDWTSAISTYWSPLYSWLLGSAVQVARETPAGLFALVHLVNFAIYVAALGAFGFFGHELALNRRLSAGDRLAHAELATGMAVAFAAGAGMLIGVGVATPDLLVATVVFAATAVLLRMARTGPSLRLGAVLGGLLALGYLAKAAMLLVAPLFILVAVSYAGSRRVALRTGCGAVLLLGAISVPWIVAVSDRAGHVTFGQAGALNQVWATGTAPAFVYYEGDPGSERLEHPPARISTAPAAYVFNRPPAASLPLWYDPPYWFAGIRSRWTFEAQWQVFRDSLREYAPLLFVLLVLLVPSLLSPTGGVSRRGLLWHLRFAAPALALLALYCLVHARYRYVGGAVAVLASALLSVCPVPRLVQHPKRRRLILGGMAVLLVAICAVQIHRLVGIADGPRGPAAQVAVARALKSFGLHRGDRVAVLADRLAPVRSYWPRLAGLRLTAAMPDVEAFWRAPESRRQLLSRRLREHGVRAIVTDIRPPGRHVSAWVRLAHTDFYALRLTPRDHGQRAHAPLSRTRPER